MVNVLIGLWLLLIILIAAAFLAYYFFPAAFPVFWRHAPVPNQGVIKRDWVATGRIDFATSIVKVTSNPEDYDQPTEFKLLVEERRIVESLAGNENLEVQWRLATLREAKAVVTQYHKYLSDHSLIKTVSDETASLPLPPPMATQEWHRPTSDQSLNNDYKVNVPADIQHRECLSPVPEGELAQGNWRPITPVR